MRRLKQGPVPAGEIILNPIKNIIVPTDFSEVSDIAERSAVALATQDGAAIHLLHVIRLPFFHTTYDLNVPEAIWEGLRRDADQQMEEARMKLEKCGAVDVRELVSESLQPAEAIAKSARELDADLVVMATHGHQGIKHAMIGSVTERTARTCPVPVLSVKGYGITEAPIERILFATDFSSHSKHALSVASSFAERFGTHVDVLHVLDETPGYIRQMSSEVADFEKAARKMAGEHLDALEKELQGRRFSVKTHLRSGSPVDIIVAEAARLRAKLIVMGTHGHTGFTHAALGSIAERTLRLAPCSVLTVRASQNEHD
jgi:nucleotide-binding universal stress UspA family protein